MKVILVVWLDACSTDSWTSRGEAEASELSEITTLGMLIKEDKKQIVVGMNYDKTNDHFSQYLAIPKAWIKTRRLLKIKL